MRGRRCATMIFSLALCGAAFNQASAADADLIAAAKKEGHVVWYTTQIINQFVRPAVAAFQKKYGIRVDYIRANASDLALRLHNEAQAGQSLADVFDGSTTVTALKKEHLVLKWTPPSAARLPRQFIDPQGYWTAGNSYVMEPGINTTLVPENARPHSYSDLLDPKWRGKIAWGSTPSASAAPGFIGLILADMGQTKGLAFLKKLARQNIANLAVSSRAIYDRVISGEYPLALQVMNHQAYISAKQGAPVAWLPFSPAMADLNVIGVLAKAPDPDAAKLLADFLVSDEGQEIFRNAGYLPVAPSVPPLDPNLRPNGSNFRTIYFTPEQIEASMPGWMKIFDAYFR